MSSLNSEDIKMMNTASLAYMGDAVYEIYVRKRVIESGRVAPSKLHRMSTGYVKAEAQAKAIRAMEDMLSEEESSVVKRGRNHRVTSKAKNTDIVTYRWATAFEALIGYLYLLNRKERMEEIIFKAMEVIDEQG